MAEQKNPADNAALDEELEQGTAAPAAEAEESSTDTASEELERLQQELTEAREQALRMAAEAQNQRRRAERDIENAHKFALEKFAGALLSVADNLERAIAASSKDDEVVKPLREGVELTLKGLLDVFAQFNIQPVDPAGAPFDPDLHQAMSIQENNEVEPNTVLHVMQKGYTLNGRLLRPAMVVVSKGAPGAGINATA
ncbi:MAG: nucleotide exchange factor GrpE [Spongiibacteraceae bacterium]|nr:nucleotide exchange factor GrpE [Spongiibacteraceae bacterium]